MGKESDVCPLNTHIHTQPHTPLRKDRHYLPQGCSPPPPRFSGPDSQAGSSIRSLLQSAKLSEAPPSLVPTMLLSWIYFRLPASVIPKGPMVLSDQAQPCPSKLTPACGSSVAWSPTRPPCSMLLNPQASRAPTLPLLL